MKNKILTIIFSLVIGGFHQAYAGVEITGMRCEYLVSPLGIDAVHPRFTWEYCGDDVPDEIPVLELSADSLFARSQKIAGNSLFSAVYDKKQGLKPHTRYYWRVRSKDGTKTVFSPRAVFETGKFTGKDWKASWISDGNTRTEPVAPIFRKEFELQSAPGQARAYISAVGYYDLYINGRRVGDHHMDPGFTDYTRRSLYVTHDVTNYLDKGENTVEIILGNGFANNQLHDVWNQENAHWRDRPQVICEIMADGDVVASTDGTWQTALSNVVYNNIYSGDHVDARRSPSSWRDAVEVAAKSGLLKAQAFPAIRPVEEIVPDRLRSFGDTLFIFDMGKNIAGVCEMRLKGAEGTTVKVRHGELLKSNGRVERGNIDIYYHPARDDEEFQTETYVLSGKPEGDLFHPRFTYHGFQYVEVLSDSPVKVEDIKGKFMRTAISRTGHFRCSDDLLNRIYDATMLSYEGNIHSIPTDCPQREKNGWTADAHVAVQLGLLNYDGITFYEKWMRDFIDAQKDNGNIPGVIPSAGWGYGEWPGPVWDAALFIIPVALYDYYGDPTCIRELYPAMKRYFDWAKSLRKPDGTITCGIGDWLSPGAQTPTEFTSTLYYYVDNRLMARIAGIAGDDPAPYVEEMNRVKDVINSRFFDKEKALYAGETQAGQGIALYWDVVPQEYRQRVADNLNDMIVSADYDTNFGLLGCKSVLRMLTKYGHPDTAYKIATRTGAHSWGYWLEKCGQSTLAETWTMDPNFRDASLNHVFFGDIAAWMTNDIAGLNFDRSRPGFEHVLITPCFFPELDWAEAEYHSVKGNISVKWRRIGDNAVELSVVLPAGVTATVLPGTSAEKTVAGTRNMIVNI